MQEIVFRLMLWISPNPFCEGRDTKEKSSVYIGTWYLTKRMCSANCRQGTSYEAILHKFDCPRSKISHMLLRGIHRRKCKLVHMMWLVLSERTVHALLECSCLIRLLMITSKNLGIPTFGKTHPMRTKSKDLYLKGLSMGQHALPVKTELLVKVSV